MVDRVQSYVVFIDLIRFYCLGLEAFRNLPLNTSLATINR
jgi:hypothetical protein